jgi:hypothetical protein
VNDPETAVEALGFFVRVGSPGRRGAMHLNKSRVGQRKRAKAETGSDNTFSFPKEPKHNQKVLMESLILAQGKRWRRA